MLGSRGRPRTRRALRPRAPRNDPNPTQDRETLGSSARPAGAMLAREALLPVMSRVPAEHQQLPQPLRFAGQRQVLGQAYGVQTPCRRSRRGGHRGRQPRMGPTAASARTSARRSRSATASASTLWSARRTLGLERCLTARASSGCAARTCSPPDATVRRRPRPRSRLASRSPTTPTSGGRRSAPRPRAAGKPRRTLRHARARHVLDRIGNGKVRAECRQPLFDQQATHSKRQRRVSLSHVNDLMEEVPA